MFCLSGFIHFEGIREKPYAEHRELNSRCTYAYFSQKADVNGLFPQLKKWELFPFQTRLSKLKTQIRLLLQEQSDLGLHCLLFHLHLLDALIYAKITFFTVF